MEKFIEDYKIELAEPGCAPGSGRWGALATIDRDISEVFPYLNAVLPDARYDHEDHTLIWNEPGQSYALRPHEIKIARAEDVAQARQIIGEIVDRLNRTWAEKATIKPRFTERKLAPALEIFKCLPKTNCRQCGYLTCLAFAADLRKAPAKLEQCQPLTQAQREKLAHLLAAD